jgi:hypothetical protein
LQGLHVLVEPHKDVTPHPRCKMNFCFQIQFDAHHERRILQFALSIDRAFEEVTYEDTTALVVDLFNVLWVSEGKRNSPTSPLGWPEMPGMGTGRPEFPTRMLLCW